MLIEKSVKMVIQRIMEQEVTDHLGRGYYERNPDCRKGYRNGYEAKKLKTAEGGLELEAPQVRGAEKTYRSELLNRLDSISPGLKHLVIEMYARGLSTRDIEDTLRDRETGEMLLSKDGVSDLTEELWEEYEKFCQRELSGYDVVYLFADAVFESLRQQAGMKDAIMCCWCITASGHRVLLHIEKSKRKVIWRMLFGQPFNLRAFAFT